MYKQLKELKTTMRIRDKQQQKLGMNTNKYSI